MRHQFVMAGLAASLLLVPACATAAKPADTLADVNSLKRTIAPQGAQPETVTKLQTKLVSAETEMTKSASKPSLNLAWTVVAATAAEAVTMVPDLSDDTFDSAKAKAFNYADTASQTCLDETASDERSGNFCTLAFAIRRLTDSAGSVRAFRQATADEDWTDAATSANAFASTARTSWPGYKTDVEQLKGAGQASLDFNKLAFNQVCRLIRAQDQTSLMMEQAPDEAMSAAQDAYLKAVTVGARFAGKASEGQACQDDPDSLQCMINSEDTASRACNQG